MKYKRIVLSFVLMFIFLLLFNFNMFAAPAGQIGFEYQVPANPKNLQSMTTSQILDFFDKASIEQIFDKDKSDVIIQNIEIGNSVKSGYVYVWTFELTNLIDKLPEDFENECGIIEPRLFAIMNTKPIFNLAGIDISVSANAVSSGGVTKIADPRLYIAFGCVESAEERNDVVKNLVQPAVKNWAGLTDIEKIINLNEFILNGQFSYDMTYKNRKSISQFIKDTKGVCEEFTTLTYLFLNEMGFENIVIYGQATTDDGRTGHHTWNMVKIEGQWYHLDILWNGPTDTSGKIMEINKEYLLKSTKTILKDHHIVFDAVNGLDSVNIYKKWTDLATQDYKFPKSPVVEPPKTETPVVTDPPKTDPPVTEQPKIDPPVTEQPKTDPLITEQPKADPPVEENPVISSNNNEIENIEPEKEIEQEVLADKSVLQEKLINYASLNLNSEDYTEETWIEYNAIYDEMMLINNDEFSTQEQIDEIILKIEMAYSRLSLSIPSFEEEYVEPLNDLDGDFSPVDMKFSDAVNNLLGDFEFKDIFINIARFMEDFYIIIIGVLIALIVIIIFLIFRKKNKKSDEKI